jgi:hypothetical protein
MHGGKDPGPQTQLGMTPECENVSTRMGGVGLTRTDIRVNMLKAGICHVKIRRDCFRRSGINKIKGGHQQNHDYIGSSLGQEPDHRAERGRLKMEFMQGTTRIPEARACRALIPELKTQSRERRACSASSLTVVDRGLLWKVAVAAIGEPMLVEVEGEQ